jgi:transcriptional regulator with XRE-family HTH domain
MDKSTHTPLYDAFRAKLKALRVAAKLTQRQLAARLGREHSFVARMEIGDRRLDVVEFYWVCRALGYDPNAIWLELASQFAKLEARKAGRPGYGKAGALRRGGRGPRRLRKRKSST